MISVFLLRQISERESLPFWLQLTLHHAASVSKTKKRIRCLTQVAEFEKVNDRLALTDFIKGSETLVDRSGDLCSDVWSSLLFGTWIT